MIPKGSVAVISHDAGGAEILSSWLKYNKVPYSLSLAGPAKTIFKHKIGKFNNQSLNMAIDNSDWVLTGTSWASDLEYSAIGLAKTKKKFVASYLDHWVNYLERFTWHGPEMLPDEIWVGDEDAKILAEKTFKSSRVRLVNNPYWIEFKREYQSIADNKKCENGIRLLYFSSNIDDIRKKRKTVNYTDNDIWEIFSNNLFKVIDKNNLKQISIRQHPSEQKSKYGKFVMENIPIVIDRNSDLIDSLKNHTHVIGHNSMALVLSQLCGLETINIWKSLTNNSLIPRKYIDHYL